MSFQNAGTPEGLKNLNEHLADNSYLAGWVPSQLDATTFHEVDKSGADTKGFVHAARWFNHIKSFSEEERAHWPAAASKAAPAEEKEKKEEGGDDDMDDLFDVDESELEAEKKRRQEEADAKKKTAKVVIQRSNLILDVKPYDDQTDLAVVEEKVRSIAMDGLVWGPSKMVEIAYGIKKLQISSVIEDEKVMTDDIIDQIMELAEDLVQSVDVAAMVKV